MHFEFSRLTLVYIRNVRAVDTHVAVLVGTLRVDKLSIDWGVFRADGCRPSNIAVEFIRLVFKCSNSC